MRVDSNTLPSMAAFDKFKEQFENHVKTEVIKAILIPVLSEPRLMDAHYAWQEDVARLVDREKNLTDGADHFKQCANLAYWLRRMAPVIEYRDIAAEIEGCEDLYEDEKERRKLLRNYGAEFLAFDFGFKICQYYELEKLDSPRPFAPSISGEYLIDVCHMMKFKHVSPHSMFLVFKSLFN